MALHSQTEIVTCRFGHFRLDDEGHKRKSAAYLEAKNSSSVSFIYFLDDLAYKSIDI